MIHFIFVVSPSIPLILFMLIFSFFFSLVGPTVHQFYIYFPKQQLFISLTFSIIFFLILFTFLILIISFILLIWIFFFISFGPSDSLLDHLFDAFQFLHLSTNCYELPSLIAFAISHKFWYVFLSSSFIPKIFLIFLFISFVSCDHSEVYYSVSMCLYIF